VPIDVEFDSTFNRYNGYQSRFALISFTCSKTLLNKEPHCVSCECKKQPKGISLGSTIKVPSRQADWYKILPQINYILKKGEVKFELGSHGLKLDAEINTALAIWYLINGWYCPTEKMIDRILDEGVSPIQERLESAGIRTYKPLHTIMFGFAPKNTTKTFNLELSPPATVKLTFKNGKNKSDDQYPLVFNLYLIGIPLLEKIAKNTLTPTEKQFIEGITFFHPRVHEKYLSQIEAGTHSLKAMATILKRSVLATLNNEKTLKVIQWLQAAGYDSFAREIIIKKTLVTPGPTIQHQT
jgi:hypothetical protein